MSAPYGDDDAWSDPDPRPCYVCFQRDCPGHGPARYVAMFFHSATRRRGWYVQDMVRSTPKVIVVIGNRHGTQIEAQSEARRLEISK